MKLKSGFEKRKARVEMLPLMDVVFLLLVFFIYSFLSMVVHRGIGVQLPGASTATLNQQDYVDVTLTANNLILVNKQPVDLENAAAAVRAARGSENRPVFISGDRSAGFGPAVELLDRLRLEGIEKVSFSCIENHN